MSRRVGAALLVVLLTAGIAVTGYWLLFSAFMPYDDEGYVLQTLRDFSAHGHLYDSVYTQYGPAFYLLYDLLHRLVGFEFTNTTGRYLTLFNWVTTAAACAGITWRLTRSGPAAYFVLGVTFYHLWSMICEPGHPGSLLVLILTLTCWAGLQLILREKLGWFALLTGVSAALLALIKINVGFFFIAATGVWLLANFRQTQVACVGAALGGAALALLSPLLMNHFLGEDWARLFAVLGSITAVTMLAAAWAARRPGVSGRDLILFLAAGMGVTAVVTAAILARGTGLPTLVEGVLLGPLRHPGVYHFAPQWRPGTLPVALASLLLAGLCWRGRRLAWLPAALAVARLLLALALFITYLEIIPLSTLAFALDFGLPLAWLLVFPLEPDRAGPDTAGRAWLGLVLAEQYLHAYPIAGSQISWGTFLLIPLVAVGAWEALAYLTRQSRAWMQPALFAGSALVCATTIFMTGSLARLGLTRYTDSLPLGLPGAENLRLPEKLASTLRTLVQNSAAHGDMLFSLPGVYSFNQWTGLPPPTLANATHWFSLLNARQQAEIAAALDHAQRPVIIVQRGVLDFLHNEAIPVGGPLYDFIQRSFTRAFAIDEYEFWVRRGRRIAPVNRAELLESREPAGGLAHWRISATLFTNGPVIAMELMQLDTSVTPLARLSAVNARLSATPLRLDGQATGATTNEAWGRPLPALAQLTVDIPGPLPSFDQRFAVLYLLDREGRRLGEARFTD